MVSLLQRAMDTPQKKPEAPAGHPKQQVVVAGGAGESLEKLLPILSKHSVLIHRVPEGAKVVQTVAKLPLVDMVLIAYPLPDMKFSDFMAAITQAVAPARPPQVLVIISKEQAQDVAGYVKQGVQVLPAHLPPEQLEKVTSRFLRKAPRPATRIMVRMEVSLGVGMVLRMAQGVNVSTSGILIRTNEDFPLGSAISLEFTLPGEQGAIQAEATVVRHSDPDREGIKGMGLKFVEIAPEHRARLADYVQKRMGKSED
jgi:uncharacterized protein (TIGR02266 family)